MKAILIDSINKEVKEVTLDPDSNMLHQWYKLLDCDMVQVGHYLNEHDSIIVDEEGLLKPCDNYFTYEGAHQPFAGSGLLVGVDDEGETVACDVSVDDVKGKIKFLDREKVLDLISKYI